MQTVEYMTNGAVSSLNSRTPTSRMVCIILPSLTAVMAGISSFYGVTVVETVMVWATNPRCILGTILGICQRCP